MRSARRPLLALLAAASAVAVAPSALAAPPGVNIGTSTGSTGKVEAPDVVAARDAGARSFRIFVDWADFETTPGQIETTRLNALRTSVAEGQRTGMQAVLVVLHAPTFANGSADRAVPPLEPAGVAQYADFVGRLAASLNQFNAPAPIWEIWNEADEGEFWRGAPEPARYGRLLKAAKARIDAADPEATVLFGALTGNNYEFFEKTWDSAPLDASSFDGVAVHTDTACGVNSPDFFVRNIGKELDGRINRFSFLGFREVHESMKARGVGEKGIYMTELGWSTFTGPCEVPGVEAGRKGGVSRDQQAAFIAKAYTCLANYPYVKEALVFDLRDRGAGTGRTEQYGIFGKPAQGVFTAIPDDGGPAGECGDFVAPTVEAIAPFKEFTGSLKLQAKVSDASGLAKVTFKVDDVVVMNFSGDKIENGKLLDDEYFGAKDLKPGNHTFRVEALDIRGNLGSAETTVVRIDEATAAATLETGITDLKVRTRKVRGKPTATLTGSVTKTGGLLLSTQVQAAWESLRPRKVRGKKRLVWVKVHGGLTAVKIKPAGQKVRFTFRQKLKFKKYRVKVFLVKTKKPYKPSTSKYLSFKVR